MRSQDSFRTINIASMLAIGTLGSLAANAEPQVLEEIVVTAQKRSELLREVPAAVSVLAADTLEASGAVELRDLNGLVPGLQVGGAAGSGAFVIRGLTTGLDVTPTVAFQIDGAPIGPVATGASGGSRLPTLDPSLISRIEVLKGPQGTLYGGNTLGGIVNFVTRPPDLEHFVGSIYAEGNDIANGGGGWIGRGLLSAPLISDHLAVQASAFANRVGGYIDSRATGESDFNTEDLYGGRLAFLWQVNGDFQIELAHLYSNQESYVPHVLYDPDTGKPLNGDLHYDLHVYPNYDSKLNVTSLNASYKLGFGTLSYVGTYQTLTTESSLDASANSLAAILGGYAPLFGGVPIPADANLGARYWTDTKKTTQELRLASPDSGSFRWLLGVFYNDENTDFPERIAAFDDSQNLEPDPLGNLLAYELFADLREVAGFADLTYYILPELDVTGGIRVGHLSQDYRQLYGGADADAVNAIFALFGYLPTPADTGVTSATETYDTYLASIRYHISEQNLVYARFATGFRPGGPNVTVPGIPATFESDSTKNYEVGWKISLWNDRAYLDWNAYYIDWQNIQILTQSQGIGGMANGEGASARGSEAAFNIIPVVGLTMTVSLAYNNAHLDDDIPGGLGNKGDRLPYAPEWSGLAALEYVHKAFGDWDGSFRAQARYVGSRYSAPPSSTVYPPYEMPSYVIVDLNASLQKGPFEFLVFARNVGDERAQLGEAFSGNTLVAVAQPRTLGVGVRYKW